MDQSLQTHVEPPRGTFQARVDDKGRLKVPSAIQEYLSKLGDTRVFITTFNLRTARVYPLSTWRVNEIFFEGFKENPQAAEDVHFVAQELGADSELDGQGRILFPTELRRRLGMENQPVWLVHYRGGFTVYSKEVYEQRMQRAFDRIEEKVDLLTQKGLL